MSVEVKLAKVEQKVDDLQKVVEAGFIRLEGRLKQLCEKLERNYVTQHEFRPVRVIVYGLVSTVCLAVLGAVLTFVIIR